MLVVMVVFMTYDVSRLSGEIVSQMTRNVCWAGHQNELHFVTVPVDYRLHLQLWMTVMGRTAARTSLPSAVTVLWWKNWILNSARCEIVRLNRYIVLIRWSIETMVDAKDTGGLRTQTCSTARNADIPVLITVIIIITIISSLSSMLQPRMM